MSRMVAFVTTRPRPVGEILGALTISRLVAASALHADGWGLAAAAAGSTPSVISALSPFRVEGVAALHTAPTGSGALYLRFASRGSAVNAENLQPFVRTEGVFAHNGALSPRDTALGHLSDRERAELRGTTDSEVFFALVRRELRRGTDEAVALARATRHLRSWYPDACLNAAFLARGRLWAVHAPGRVPPPFAAFAARGWERADLPAGHDADYNVLSVHRPDADTAMVTSAGIAAGGDALPEDAVTEITPAGAASSLPL